MAIYNREAPTPQGQGPVQRHLYFDTIAELAVLPKLNNAAPGSDAFCIETSQVFILRKDTGEWEEI